MQLNSTLQRIILIFALIVIIAGYNLWRFAWHGFFYQCNALFISLITFLLKDLSRQDKKLNAWAKIVFWLSINNLCDEIFFDPKSFGWNEIFFALLIVFLTLKKSKNARP
jgi:hypothetical protein